MIASTQYLKKEKNLNGQEIRLKPAYTVNRITGHLKTLLIVSFVYITHYTWSNNLCHKLDLNCSFNNQNDNCVRSANN